MNKELKVVTIAIIISAFYNFIYAIKAQNILAKIYFSIFSISIIPVWVVAALYFALKFKEKNLLIIYLGYAILVANIVLYHLSKLFQRDIRFNYSYYDISTNLTKPINIGFYIYLILIYYAKGKMFKVFVALSPFLFCIGNIRIFMRGGEDEYGSLKTTVLLLILPSIATIVSYIVKSIRERNNYKKQVLN